MFSACCTASKWPENECRFYIASTVILLLVRTLAKANCLKSKHQELIMCINILCINIPDDSVHRTYIHYMYVHKSQPDCITVTERRIKYGSNKIWEWEDKAFFSIYILIFLTWGKSIMHSVRPQHNDVTSWTSLAPDFHSLLQLWTVLNLLRNSQRCVSLSCTGIFWAQWLLRHPFPSLFRLKSRLGWKGMW